MSSFVTGRQSEAAAANYLIAHGYSVLAQNWKTKYCEIDIVAQKANRIYFVEVKFRKRTNWGEASAYITARKLQRMHFAAESWVYRYHWQGEYQLAAICIDGNKLTFANL